jgi:hypothetical protein
MDTRSAVAPADIQRLAQRYLVPANRVIATTRRNPAQGGGR